MMRWRSCWLWRAPELDVRALVTVAGNVRLDLTTAKCAEACASWAGARPSRPCRLQQAHRARPHHRQRPWHHRHGWRRSAGAQRQARSRERRRLADRDLVERRQPKSQTLLPIGPLTNIARRFQRAPGIAEALREIVIMGGATPKIGGNMSPHAEFNIFVDPEAADYVFGLGLPITLVPLDLSHQMVVTMERHRTLCRHSRAHRQGRRRDAALLSQGRQSSARPADRRLAAEAESVSAAGARRSGSRPKVTRSGETVFDWREDGPCNVLLQGDHAPSSIS